MLYKLTQKIPMSKHSKYKYKVDKQRKSVDARHADYKLRNSVHEFCNPKPV